MMRNFSAAFFRGLIVLLPVVISIQVTIWVFKTMESWLAPGLKAILGGVYFPGMAIILVVLLTAIIGFSSRWPAADFFWGLPGRLLERLPVLKQIYGALKEVMDIMGGKKFEEESVVMVELPGTESSLIGIVTVNKKGNGNTIASELKEDQIAVYLPMSYQVGGYTVIVPKKYTRPLKLTPAEALQLVLSGGVISEKTRGVLKAGEQK
ncbi:DUF502 domain-containing protein [Litorivivens sp.]|uniref:DUF502 domain-containing protein n=1 Tax=Litorivivens sp. TaxID=2020868 RepID=UPI00356888BD